MTYDTINDARTIAGNGEGALLAGRYRVVRQLGQGGMGSVWLAEDTQLDNKLFAIKVLPAILVSNKRAYRQLKDEALVAMKLTHPNIVTLRAFEENNGNPFLVMDYIDGQTLGDYLAEKGKLSEGDVLRVLRPIAAALDYAHSKGVVHRDVKPGNVMIAKDGTPYILDFGIAREIQETMTRVTGKLSSGTLLYMSPEQLMGESPKPAQDIYSFAAMAYECLKGEPPFVRGAIEDQIKNKQPDPLPKEVLTGNAAILAAGVMAGLAKKPEDRPASCTTVMEGQNVRVERVDGVGANFGHKERKERKGGVGKLLAVVAFLAALVGGGYYGWTKYDEGVKAREAKRIERSMEQSIEKRMKEMILPSIAFRPPDTIVDAVDFFRQASKYFDSPDIPVDQRGFNFILTLNKTLTGGGDAPAGDNNAETAFGAVAEENMSGYDVPQIPDIAASNISLWEALDHVCKQVGFKFEVQFMFEVQGCVVMVMPKNMTTDEHEEREREQAEERTRIEKSSNVSEKQDVVTELTLAEQESRQREVARLAELRVDIGIKYDDAKEKMGRLAAYRGEPDEFKVHIDNADTKWKIVETVERNPTTVVEAEKSLNSVTEAENAIAKELHWLSTNKTARDGAKTVEAEIVRVVDPELKRFKADDYARDLFGAGDHLRREGNAALSRGDFLGAKEKLDKAKAKLSEAAANAKKFCIDTHLNTAKKWLAASRWQQCVEECNTVLGWDSANADAKEIKTEAEGHLIPTADIEIIVDGCALGKGETVKIGNTSWATPIKWGKGNIQKGKKYGGKVLYERGSRRYFGELATFTVNWSGPTNMIVVLLTEYKGPARPRVQLWEGGPYWATTNIGAEKPEDYGYYFWWGDTMGYKREGNSWVASNGSGLGFSFDERSIPTYGKSEGTLKKEEWITARGVLAPKHDVACVQWGGGWRMPTKQELDDLENMCDWIWTTVNGVNGYAVRGRGNYASSSIFLPCAGDGDGTSLYGTGSYGAYWSSVPVSGSGYYSWLLSFNSSRHYTYYSNRSYGRSVRPVQGFTK